jgi:hypothetical protein
MTLKDIVLDHQMTQHFSQKDNVESITKEP